jgi:hypothetical protein
MNSTSKNIANLRPFKVEFKIRANCRVRPQIVPKIFGIVENPGFNGNI